MSHVVIAGGTGLVGRELTAMLTRLGYSVVVLSRSGNAPVGARGETWDGATEGPWCATLENAAAVINLAGTPISVKWDRDAKNAILQSRVASTEVIGRALSKAAAPPPVWINASAVGYYGDRADEVLTESSAPGKRRDFLVDTCVAWEASMDQAPTTVRKVKLRTGIVLAKDGGALPPLAKLTRFFLGGPVGAGDQFVSWIHIKDLVRLIVHVIEKPVEGAVNGVAPHPATNRFLMATMRGVIGRPWAPPVPAFALRLANMFGAPDPSLLLYSQRVEPRAALDSGFTFEFDDLRDALRDLL